MRIEFVLKIDVDTYRGMHQGVPHLLAILRQEDVRASFFLSLGPDCSGRAIWRIFRKRGFLAKMLRTNAPGMYGVKTMLYGTLLPAPLIASLRFDLRKISAQGHQVGVHAWDHVYWQDHLPRLGPRRIKHQLHQAWRLYQAHFQHYPDSFAAPGWIMSSAAWQVLQNFGITHCSNTRGYFPFRPCYRGRCFDLLEIPTTLPTLDEGLGRVVMDRKDWNDYLMAQCRPGLNVLTVHAETEGMAYANLFQDFLRQLKKRGACFRTLRQIYQSYVGCDWPTATVVERVIPGRAGRVSCQSDN